VWNVHVKDTKADGTPALFGEGDVDYGSVWIGLAAIGYDGPFGIETLVKSTEEMPLEPLIAHEAGAIRGSLGWRPL
jgi:sugar phosphate isomerase/epimerase